MAALDFDAGAAPGIATLSGWLATAGGWAARFVRVSIRGGCYMGCCIETRCCV